MLLITNPCFSREDYCMHPTKMKTKTRQHHHSQVGALLKAKQHSSVTPFAEHSPVLPSMSQHLVSEPRDTFGRHLSAHVAVKYWWWATLLHVAYWGTGMDWLGSRNWWNGNVSCWGSQLHIVEGCPEMMEISDGKSISACTQTHTYIMVTYLCWAAKSQVQYLHFHLVNTSFAWQKSSPNIMNKELNSRPVHYKLTDYEFCVLTSLPYTM